MNILLFGREILKVFFEMAPYLLLGLTFAGLLHVFFNKQFVIKHLGNKKFSSVFYAALLGVPLPLCSCGVVPTALSLKKSNASNGATVSFLISTPQTGIDSIIATYGMLGGVFAVFRPIIAFIMGIVGGILTNVFDTKHTPLNIVANNSVQCSLCTNQSHHSHTWIEKIRSAFTYGYGEFLDDIAKQLVVGLLVSAVISFFLPPNFFSTYIGNSVIEMLIMLVGSIPLYVCATASIPIAMALMAKGVSAGAAFVFLTAGPATNIASLIIIAHALGKKVTSIYLSTICICSLIAGFALNALLALPYFTTQTIALQQHSLHHVHSAQHNLFQWNLTLFFSLIFLFLLLCSLTRIYAPSVWKKISPDKQKELAQPADSPSLFIHIEGMTCSKCVAHVTDAIQGVEGVTHALVSLRDKSASVTGSFDRKKIYEAIQSAGYTVKK